MDPVRELKRHGGYQHDERTTVGLYEVRGESGYTFVGLRIEQQLSNGRRQEFKVNVELLEAIEGRAAAYTRSGETAERSDQVADIRLRFKRLDGQVVAVELAQDARNGAAEDQVFWTRAETLKTALRKGQELERELGLGPKWHVLVNAQSLTADEAGRIHAGAVRSFDNEERARLHLGKSSGLALYLEPQRHEFTKGDTIELRPEGNMLLRGEHALQPVKQQLAEAEWSRERDGTHYRVARWTDRNQEPAIGQRVTIVGSGYTYNGEPEDFRARTLAGEPGYEGEPKWVLIAKDDRRPGRGTVLAVSGERAELTQELKRREEVHQAVTREWDQQSFTMERDRYTQGYSM